MGTWAVWTKYEKDKAVELKKNGYKLPQIAAIVGKSYEAVSGLLKRLRKNELPVVPMEKKLKTLSPAEELKRINCHKNGLADGDSARECGISRQDYTGWRISAGLEPNETLYRKIKEHKNARVGCKKLTAKDIVHYNHLENKPVENNANNDMKMIVDKELAEKLLADLGIKPAKMKLKDGPQGSRCGTVIGSRWTSEYNHTTAKQGSYAHAVKRIAGNE